MTVPGVLTTNVTTGYVFNELTASDITEYTPEAGLKALFVMTTGDAVLVDHDDASITLAVTAGWWLYIRPKKFMATGSTATLMGIFS